MTDNYALGAWPVWTQGHGKLWRGLPLTLLQLWAVQLQQKKKTTCVYDFPIVSLWELSAAMETRVLIRFGPKPNATLFGMRKLNIELHISLPSLV